MTSSADNKTCGVCSGSIATGQGQSIFTAECSHSFHFTCVVRRGDRLCPVCNAAWNQLPFTVPTPNTNVDPTNVFHRLFNYIPFQFCPTPTPQFPPVFGVMTHQPQYPPEPLQFSDDEPLIAVTADPMSSVSPVGLQKVMVKAVPERLAVAASESVSLFTVLVGLKAPSLSNDAGFAQRAPIDLVTVLDVSGSMDGMKLDLVKRAVNFVIDNLSPSDRLSVVSFANQARRMLPLRRMGENGREDAKRAVYALMAHGGTNIVEGLKKGVRVLEERRHKNPVTSIIFLSDGNDTCNNGSGFPRFSSSRQPPKYLHLLPASIRPGNRGKSDVRQLEMFPVHSFGFGLDHDPIAMHSISDASGGTFSFIESYGMVQDAFASYIGGLLSVVTQDVRLMVRSASHGVEIKSIHSGRYASEISNQGSQGLIKVGDLYADEEKEFLINLSVPAVPIDEREENGRKTTLLDVTCSYQDVASKEMVQVEGDLVEIRRPNSLSPSDMTVNLDVDRQKNRLRAAESIAEAQQMAETGNLIGARDLLARRRTDLLATASAQAGDGLSLWLEADMKETEQRMGNEQLYQQAGRAFALSGMSSHASQRATTRGKMVAGAAAPVESFSFGAATGPVAQSAAIGPVAQSAAFGAYATPNMANMVSKSQQLNKREGIIAPK
ncbi:E3 ubiquitin-protein ligase WAV3 [Sesamum alatum]|uniref:E3 ubiquitin-protein ligase WAV3 n=1 Tax=Sesamum alatum TaxID=300844 RepID=A0AAE2CQS2_9LAMI|nr:E3 ubiquitin-protein ligase WAV3 [Sesamum alatum]